MTATEDFSMNNDLFSIVKNQIDALDPCGLLAGGAPKDEYDLESREISQRITPDCSPQEIAELMVQVFEAYFEQTYDPDFFLDAAARIWAELS